MKKLAALFMVACMAVSMTACGGSGGKDTTTQPAGTEKNTGEAEKTTESTAETTTEGTTDGTVSSPNGTVSSPNGASSDKTWVIAMDTVFRPFEYTNEKSEFVGIDVDIIKAVAENQGFEIEIQSLGWDAAVAAVQAGQADALLAGASITDERKASGWIFSDGYFTATQSFAVAAGSDVAGLEDLKGKNVAVKNGTAGADYAQSLKDKYGFTVTTFDDSPTMYQDVVLGNSVACVEDTPIMADSIKNGGVKLQILEGTENEGADYGLAIMSSNAQELLDMFNAGLKAIRADGTYDKIISTYIGE